MSKASIAPQKTKIDSLLGQEFPVARWMFIPGGFEWKEAQEGRNAGRSAHKESNVSLGYFVTEAEKSRNAAVEQQFATELKSCGFVSEISYSAYKAAYFSIKNTPYFIDREEAVMTMQSFLIDALNLRAKELGANDVAEALSKEDDRFNDIYNHLVILNQVQEVGLSSIEVEARLHDEVKLQQISGIVGIETESEAGVVFTAAYKKFIDASHDLKLIATRADEISGPDKIYLICPEIHNLQALTPIVQQAFGGMGLEESGVEAIRNTMRKALVSEHSATGVNFEVSQDLFVDLKLASILARHLTKASKQGSISLEDIDTLTRVALQDFDQQKIGYVNVTTVLERSVQSAFVDIGKFDPTVNYYDGIAAGTVTEESKGGTDRFKKALVKKVHGADIGLRFIDGQYYIPSELADQLVPKLAQTYETKLAGWWNKSPQLAVYHESVEIASTILSSYKEQLTILSEQQSSAVPASEEEIVAAEEAQLPKEKQKASHLSFLSTSVTDLSEAALEALDGKTVGVTPVKTSHPSQVRCESPVRKEVIITIVEEGASPLFTEMVEKKGFSSSDIKKQQAINKAHEEVLFI